MLCNKNNLTPFQLFCYNNFPFIEDSIDALNNYQLFCKIAEYLYKNDMKTTELENLVNELKNYFENLDVQDEINNKLDEMSQNGELTEIISTFLNNVTFRIFNNVEDLKNANISEGQFVETLGYYSINDSGNAKYIIVNGDYSESSNYDVIELKNGLFAKMITKFYNSKINVKSFGAKGDGISDDYNAIQKCIFYCADNELICFIPNGNYLISSQLITVTSDEDSRIEKTFIIEGESSLTKINKYVEDENFINLFNFTYVNKLFITNIYSDSLSSTLINNNIYQQGFDFWSKLLKKKHFEFNNFFGTGEGYQKLICLPAPTKSGRYGDGSYDDYPLRINNNSGYNAVEIENFGYNQEDETSTPTDNSAIGIIDAVTNSTGVIFIDMKGDRSFERYIRNNSNIQSKLKPGTVWEISKDGHIAIGCSTDYNDDFAKSVSAIKVRDNSPEIALFDANNQNKSAILKYYLDENNDKSFAIIIDGDTAIKFLNKWRNNKIVSGVKNVKIIVNDDSTDNLSFYILNDDETLDKEFILSPQKNGDLRYGDSTKSINDRFKIQTVVGNEKWYRPTLSSHIRDVGSMYFDTTLNKPIWWNGTDWVDSTGSIV